MRADGNGTVVQALDPRVIAEVSGTPGLDAIAEDAGRRIDTALDALRSGSMKA